jgi:hypothetical protein
VELATEKLVDDDKTSNPDTGLREGEQAGHNAATSNQSERAASENETSLPRYVSGRSCTNKFELLRLPGSKGIRGLLIVSRGNKRR